MGKMFLRGMLASEHAATVHNLIPNLQLLYAVDGIFFNTWFESLDQCPPVVTGSGTVTIVEAGVRLSTGTTISSLASIMREPLYPIVPFTWAKKRRFKTKVEVYAITNQEIYIVTGWYGTGRHVGFKVVDNILYGTVADGTTEATVALVTLTGTTIMLLEAIFTPGVKCEFYVDGTLRGTLTTNLPSGTDVADVLFYLRMTNTAAEDKRLWLNQLMMIQEP